MTIVGLINPGAMGVSVGAAAATNAERVIWASAGRSQSTRTRAEQAGLVDVDTLGDLFGQADIVLSVCPPDSAELVSDSAIEHQFTGLYVEGNAISPDLTRQLAHKMTAAGARFVDGGIIGGPAWSADAGTKLWLSGPDTTVIEALFEGSPLHTGVVNAAIGSASALKMTFAAYTKGTTALLMATLAVAEKEGVRQQLQDQWGETFTNQTHQRVINNSAKAWRFAGEMEQISATFAALGLQGFHDSAARLFERMYKFKDWQQAPKVEALIQSITDDSNRKR